MKISNKLNDYSVDEKNQKEFKSNISVCLIVGLFLLVIFIVLTLFFTYLYSLLIGFVVGAILSVILYYLTDKIINETYYLDLKKAVRKIHGIYQIVYCATFLIFIIIFKNYYVAIGLVVGFLLVKISIFIKNIVKKE